MDGPGLEHRGFPNVERAAGIQQWRRHSEHLKEDAETERHEELPAGPSRKPVSGTKAPVITHASHSACLPDMPHRTTSTEQLACCTTLVDMLPRRNRPMAPKPFAPVTIRSASWVSATFRISSAGLPIVGTCSTR